ncbi:MAG: hypothetical protein WKF43_09090 [Acidimicrobiales bacterium]
MADRPVVTSEEIGRFRAGDTDAMRSVYRAYGRLVYAVAHNALGHARWPRRRRRRPS